MTGRSLPEWVADAQEEGAVVLDGRRRVVAANRAARELLGPRLAGVLAAPVEAPPHVRVRERPGPDEHTLVTLTPTSRARSACARRSS